MHHHVIGYGAEANAWVVVKWCWFWIFAFGLPCALAMFAPPWVKTERGDTPHVH